MEIFVSKTSDMVQDRQAKQPKKPKKNRSDRRKNRSDRRQSGQEGVVVSLSYREENRGQQDRRQVIAYEPAVAPEVSSPASQSDEQPFLPDNPHPNSKFDVVI